MRRHLSRVRQNMIADHGVKNTLLAQCSYRYLILECDGQVQVLFQALDFLADVSLREQWLHDLSEYHTETWSIPPLFF